MMLPESQFGILPHEINLDVVHGQEPGSPPPRLIAVEDAIDIQQITSDSPYHTPLHDEMRSILHPISPAWKKS